MLRNTFCTDIVAQNVQIMFLHPKRKHGTIDINRFPDEELIIRYQATKNSELIAELFERYIHLVYGICLGYFRDRDTCKDAVMEIFESLFEKLLRFQVKSFKNWLYAVSKNYCLMSLRREAIHKRIRYNGDHIYQLLEETEKKEESELKGLELTDSSNEGILSHAIEKLNIEQNTCIRLLYLEEKSYKEISNLTGYSLKQIKSYIQNGKRNLKNYILNHYGR